ncbi:hypothetical protein ONZ45_g19719 [Pleurotus djamor]|nr:hypothetical protein ONZ45_g19719 [Pleurotus djamor]
MSGTKRASTSKTSTRASKRRRKTTTASSAPHHVAASCGVGPSSPLPTATPSSVHTDDSPRPRRQPLRPSGPCTHTSNTADDVWYFLRALESRDPPPAMPPPDSEPPLRTNPCSPFVGSQHLKHADDDLLGDSPSSSQGRIPFTVEHFIYLVMRWMVADDQSMNVLDCQEFRDVLAYLGADKITNGDIPHRTKITIDILHEFEAEQQRLREEMERAIGRVSFTSDIWSDPNLDGYMGVTAHYIVRNIRDNHLEWKSHLIAFQIIEGDHTGVNIANHFLTILDKYGITHKLGQITLDNASNNNTFLEELEVLLAERDIPFDHEGNRIRCFPHVVNLACDAFLDSIKKDAMPSDGNAPIPGSHDFVYATMLESDLVGHCRKVVAACRASGKRRHRLREIIYSGNCSGYWKGKILRAPEKSELPEVQLLRDYDFNFTASFMMLL